MVGGHKMQLVGARAGAHEEHGRLRQVAAAPDPRGAPGPSGEVPNGRRRWRSCPYGGGGGLLWCQVAVKRHPVIVAWDGVLCGAHRPPPEKHRDLPATVPVLFVQTLLYEHAVHDALGKLVRKGHRPAGRRATGVHGQAGHGPARPDANWPGHVGVVVGPDFQVTKVGGHDDAGVGLSGQVKPGATFTGGQQQPFPQQAGLAAAYRQGPVGVDEPELGVVGSARGREQVKQPACRVLHAQGPVTFFERARGAIQHKIHGGGRVGYPLDRIL